jgi:hypothetical protein
MATPYDPNAPRSYGKLLYPPDQYSSSDNTFVAVSNAASQPLAKKDFTPDYTTVPVFPSLLHMLI